MKKQKYEMRCENGWHTEISAATLRGAKCAATRNATHGCGSYILEAPDGGIYSRHKWGSINTWGWEPWVRLDR